MYEEITYSTALACLCTYVVVRCQPGHEIEDGNDDEPVEDGESVVPHLLFDFLQSIPVRRGSCAVEAHVVEAMRRLTTQT